MKKRILVLLAALTVAVPPAVGAQTNAPRPRQPANGENRNDPYQDMDIPHDMRVRLTLERAESERRKAVEDADKLNTLSDEVMARYRETQQLTAEEMKKVAAIEKLAKRVLSHAGGDEVDDKDAPPPASVAEALEQMSEAAAQVKKSLTEETRYVVSASLIANANQVINLAQYIRRAEKRE